MCGDCIKAHLLENLIDAERLLREIDELYGPIEEVNNEEPILPALGESELRKPAKKLVGYRG